MKKINFTSKKLIILSAILLITLICAAFATSVFASESSSEWTFSENSVGDPIYVKEYFDKLPRAYEAEVNFPEGTYSTASPIISNYRNNDANDSFGFEIHASGKPAMYFYETSYDAATAKLIRTKTYIKFDNYNVIGKDWVRVAVSNEIDKATGKSIYKLYVNGECVQTVTDYTTNVYIGTSATEASSTYDNYIHEIDPIYSQSTNRELSIGNDGKNYFKGSLRSVAVYENALTVAEASNTAKANMQAGSANLMAYYDSTMSGNSEGFMKDHTKNGHDASKPFFERKEAVKDYAYSFAFVGDTQFLMSRDGSQNTTSFTGPIYDWLVQNKDEKKIEYVLGLGDVTDRDSENEWKKAVNYHNQLTAAGIPYAVIPGNHDDYKNYTLYNQYFGSVSAFTENIDGYYKDGRVENYYMNFEVGSNQYMILALQYGAPDDVLAWANNVVSRHPNRQVIVITHALFGYEGQWAEKDTREQTTAASTTFNNGIDMWNEFISLHENIIITAAGHVDPMDIKHRTDVGVNGNTVHSFLIDPQGLDKATDFKTGMVAMFYFSEDGTDVQVEYISATKTLAAQAADKTADDILYQEKNQFSFTVDKPEDDGSFPNYALATGNGPFYVFAKGTEDAGYGYIGSKTNFREAIGLVRDSALGDKTGSYSAAAYKGGKAWIYVKKTSDTLPVGGTNNWNFGDTLNGEVVIDLDGNTISIPQSTKHNHLIGINTESDRAGEFTTSIKIMNGTIITRATNGADDKSVIRFNGSKSAYSGVKQVNIEFDGVTFESSNTGTTPPIILATGDYYTKEQQVKANIVFNSCSFNFPNSTSFNVLKDIVPNDAEGNDYAAFDITIKGSTTINAPKADAKMFIDTVGNKDSVTVSTTTTIILPFTEKAPTVTYTTTAGVLGFASKTQKVTLTSVEYVLSDNYINGYGYIPESEIYRTFSVFLDGYHIASYDTYYDSVHRAVVLLKDDASGGIFTGKKLTIYMHKNYKHTDSSYNNLAQINGTLCLDLNGKILTLDKNYLFDAWAKGMSKKVGDESVFFLPDTKIEVKNGTINSKSYIARISGTGSGTNFAYTGTKNYNFTFTNVTFDRIADGGYYPVIFVNSFDNNGGKKFLNCDATFNNCTFNTSDASILDFNLSDNVLSNVVMQGCTINASGVNANTILAASEGKKQTLTLSMDTVLKLPKNASKPSYDVVYSTESGIDSVFVESTQNGDNVNYTLYPKALAGYKIKTSVSLWSNFVYNIYIPSTNVVSFTVNGNEHEYEEILIDGVSYYRIAVNLPASETLSDIKLKVTLNSGSANVDGKWTLSVLKYTKAIIAGSYDDVTKTLMKDMLAYASAAHTYFEKTDAVADKLSEVADILKDYSRAVPTGTAKTPAENNPYFKDVAIYLGEVPSFRFYLASGYTKDSFAFTVGERSIEATLGNDNDGKGDYLEIVMYAYMMLDDVSYTVNGTDVSESYNIYSYYEFAKTQNNKNLVAIVEALMKYSASANAYRNTVIGA